MNKIIKTREQAIACLKEINSREDDTVFYLSKFKSRLDSFTEDGECLFITEFLCENGMELQRFEELSKSLINEKLYIRNIANWICKSEDNKDFLVRVLRKMTIDTLYSINLKYQSMDLFIQEIDKIDADSLDDDSPLNSILGDIPSLKVQVKEFNKNCKYFQYSLDTRVVSVIDSWYCRFESFIDENVTSYIK